MDYITSKHLFVQMRRTEVVTSDLYILILGKLCTVTSILHAMHAVAINSVPCIKLAEQELYVLNVTMMSHNTALLNMLH